MTKDKMIFQTLYTHLSHVTNNLGIAEDRIIGIFLYGSQNYGTDTSASDIDSKVIVLPTFEDFCLRSNNLISQEVILDNGEHIDIKDIRIFRDNLYKQNINYIETLFTDYCIINPKYATIFNKYFIENREFIATLDRKKGILSMGHQAIHTLGQKEGDNKKLYNGHRLTFFLENYVENKPYLKCLKPDGNVHKKLMDIKNGVYNFKHSKEEESKKLIQFLKDFMNNYKDIDSPNAEKGKLAVDQGVIELLKYYFNQNKIKNSKK